MLRVKNLRWVVKRASLVVVVDEAKIALKIISLPVVTFLTV